MRPGAAPSRLAARRRRRAVPRLRDLRRRRPARDAEPRRATLAEPGRAGEAIGPERLSHAAQARKLGVAGERPRQPLREGNRVLVEVGFDHGAAAGSTRCVPRAAKIVDASRRYQTVTVAVPPEALPDLRRSRRRRDRRGKPGADRLWRESSTAAVGAECEGGSVVSEGDGLQQDQLHARRRAANSASTAAASLSASSPTPSTRPRRKSTARTDCYPCERRRRKAVTCPGLANSCAGEQDAGQRARRPHLDAGRSNGRGAGDGCRSSTTSLRAPRLPSPRLSRGKSPSPKTSKGWRPDAGAGQGDRRRRRLLRRALLPGRSNRRGRRQSHRGRRLLLLGRRQRQPVRRRTRNRLLGSSELSRHGLSCRSAGVALKTQLHCMDFNPSGATPTTHSGSRSKKAPR